MPQIIIDIEKIVKRDDEVSFVATTEGKRIERELKLSDVENTESFAEWLINQEPDSEDMPSLRKRLTIDFHVEVSEWGDYRVLDNVVAEELP